MFGAMVLIGIILFLYSTEDKVLLLLYLMWIEFDPVLLVCYDRISQVCVSNNTRHSL